MLTIDDAAILKRAQELCQRYDIAWNLSNRISQDMRVLTDQDRRECLMRARDELMRAAEEEVRQNPAPVTSQLAASLTGSKTENLPEEPVRAATTAPTRRVA